MFPNFEIMALVYQDMFAEDARNRMLAEEMGRQSQFAKVLQSLWGMLTRSRAENAGQSATQNTTQNARLEVEIAG